MPEQLPAEGTIRDSWANVLEDLTGLDRERATAVVSCCSSVTTTDTDETRVPADAALIVVESGTLMLAAHEVAGRSAILAFALRGDLLVPPLDREALIGLGGGTIRILDRQTLAQLVAIEGVAPCLIKRLSAVVHDRQESLRLATINPLRERARQKLLQLAQSHGRVRPDGVRIALPLTHELLARTMGSSRESVTLAMRELRREGFLARTGRSYVLRIRPRELDTGGTHAAATAA
jgi:CRP-like cAMP-binding protein